MRLRLLPSDRSLGWVPYVWLIYILGFVAFPFMIHASPRVVLVTLLGTVVFLGLYFWGYWLNGPGVVWSAGGIALLALAYSPWNPGAASLWIYAGAGLAKMGRPRLAVRGLFVLLGLLALESWLAHLALYFWLSAGVFTLIIGGVSIQQEQFRRTHNRLLRAQDEVERLAKVAERERIGRDLHDLLGHTLSLITLKAELAGKLLARDDTPAARREIGDLERISREALREVRSAVTGYRAEDLRAEISRARMALDTAEVAFTVPGESAFPLDLTPAEDSALAFALREAVTNVVRHARARSCQVRIETVGDTVRLEVADDGRGGETMAPEGSGLSGMRERIAALGGKVERESGGAAGGGAGGPRLIVTLPRGISRQAGPAEPARPRLLAVRS